MLRRGWFFGGGLSCRQAPGQQPIRCDATSRLHAFPCLPPNSALLNTVFWNDIIIRLLYGKVVVVIKSREGCVQACQCFGPPLVGQVCSKMCVMVRKLHFPNFFCSQTPGTNEGKQVHHIVFQRQSRPRCSCGVWRPSTLHIPHRSHIVRRRLWRLYSS